MLSGKPFFTKQRIAFILRRIILPFFAIYSLFAIVTLIRDVSIKSDAYAAVLLSDYAITKYDYWASPSAFLGSYITWSHYFNSKNMKVKWFLRAKGMDLEAVIKDKNCQSIVLVGHGSLNLWQATDTEITNYDVIEIMKGLPKKKGEWLQLTCGEEDFSPFKMGELVMEKGQVYTYDKGVTTYAFVADAIFAFKNLKHAWR